MATFTFHGQRLAYTEHGEGPRVCVLLHSLLLSQRMHVPLARTLAERGQPRRDDGPARPRRVRPPADMWRYSMPLFGDQVVALLDQLELDEAVIAGTSLGANVALMTAAQSPDRVRGLVVEMPVLDNALVGCAIAFSPLLVALTFGAPARAPGRARRAPRAQGPPAGAADVVLDSVGRTRSPRRGAAGALLRRVAPHRSERRRSPRRR